MGCCSKNSRDPDSYSLEAGTGLTKNRKCTDILFIIIFLAFCGLMGYIIFTSLPTGSPYAVLYGRDSWGNVCNRPNKAIDGVPLSGEDNTGLSKTFYMNPLALMRPSEYTAVMCVKSCPQKNIMTITELKDFADSSGNDTRLCHYNIQPDSYQAHYTGTDSIPVRKETRGCPLMPVMEHVEVANVCTPKFLTDLTDSSIDAAIATADAAASFISPTCEKEGSFFDKAWGDILASGNHILYLSLIALGVAFIITILMGVIATIIIWTMLIVMALGSVAATALCWYMWYTKKTLLASNAEPTDNQIKDVQDWMIIAIVVSVISVVVLLILLVMRKRIKLVAQLFMEASSAIRKMPLLLLQPVFTFLLLGIALGGLLLGASFIMTSGAPTTDDNGFVSFVPTEVNWYLRWAYLLGALWWVEFIFACEQMVIAGAVSMWFFSRDKTALGLPILKSIKNLIRFHLGTVLFGSFLIALVKLAQMVLSYLSRTLQARRNKVVKYLLLCLQCCLWCFEKFLKFVNRNAYIMTAIHGYNFCKGAWAAFQIIIGNALRVAAINSVGAFCLLLGKLGIVAITVYLGFQFFIGVNPVLCYFYIPLGLVALISFIIAHCFLGVYSMTIDTIFICFCEDCTHNDGVEKPYFMSKGLMEFVEGSKKEEKKKEK